MKYIPGYVYRNYKVICLLSVHALGCFTAYGLIRLRLRVTLDSVKLCMSNLLRAGGL